jgi:thiamine biosynthesis lipoprotein
MAFTSGIYARQHQTENGSAHHIIDPRSGAPAHGNIAVTLIGRDGMLLQAMCKAVLIAGEQWPAMAKRNKLFDVFVLNSNAEIELSITLLEKLNDTKPTRFKAVSLY